MKFLASRRGPRAHAQLIGGEVSLAHFDKLMRGRTGIPRPRSEAELTPYRHRFAEMFTRLKSEHGVAPYLAHNMTVTPDNIDEVADVVGEVVGMGGFPMVSFLPAVFVGDERRWHGDYREIDIDTTLAVGEHARDEFFIHLGGMNFAR